jgi:hypothetical protein
MMKQVGDAISSESVVTGLDALPPSLADSATADALRTICDLDLSELQGIEPPRGFGRDCDANLRQALLAGMRDAGERCNHSGHSPIVGFSAMIIDSNIRQPLALMMARWLGIAHKEQINEHDALARHADLFLAGAEAALANLKFEPVRDALYSSTVCVRQALQARGSGALQELLADLRVSIQKNGHVTVGR